MTLFKQFVFTRLYYFGLWKLKKTRRLNFVSFSGLENSETKLRNETKLSETKLSGDSISLNMGFLELQRGVAIRY